jgi:hypothetical protein
MRRTSTKKKLTIYDPAEDLGSDEAIAVFMGEAFGANYAAYISHALGMVARKRDGRKSPSRQACRANSSTGRSAGKVTQR